MHLMRLGRPGKEIPVLVEDGVTYKLDVLTGDLDGAFFANDGIEKAHRALQSGTLDVVDPTGIRVAAPIAQPQAILCTGQNYAAHAAESGAEPPSVPILFHKHPATMVGPYDDVMIPRGATKVDWEVELGAVIAKQARYLSSPAEAAEYIAGYVVSNDVSERVYQLEESGGQWSKGKNAETFNPVGPWLVPAEDVDPQQLRLWSRVNSGSRQDSTTADMIFTVAEIVHHLSQYMVLQPGDLINTGTPEGVALSGRFPYLEVGDVMELGVDHLGEQRQRLVSAD